MAVALVALLWFALALAADPPPVVKPVTTLAPVGPPPPPPPPPGEDSDASIVVYGHGLEVERARQQLMKELEKEGYTKIIRRDGYTVLRHDDTWSGEVLLYDDGWVRIKRQPVQIRPIALPFAREGTVLSWAACLVAPFACVRTSGVFYGKRKFAAVKNRTLSSVEPEIQNLADRVADEATAGTVDALPDRLDALWADGIPLDPGDRQLTSFDDRKAALLDYWDTRSDTPWGDRVRVAVEGFLIGVVQVSDHPFTADEIAAFNVRRQCARALDLSNPRPADPGDEAQP